MRTIFLGLALLLVTGVFGQSLNLTGKWKAASKEGTYWLIFSGDSSVSMIHKTDTTRGSYRIDTTQSPIHFDLVSKSPDNTAQLTMKGILEVMGTGKIRVRFSAVDPTQRPKNFLPRGNPDAMVFVKQ